MSSGSNLPPGVTGHEDAFGPRFEQAEDRDCDGCGWSGPVDVAYWNTSTTWQCPDCKAEHDEEPDAEPDYFYED